MKFLALFILILSFSSFSNDEELEGYTFQNDYQTKDSERTVAANKDKQVKDSKTEDNDVDQRIKPQYWEWTEKEE